jgi:hypothetical protein
MSEDLKDILSNLNPEVNQETLLRYLQDRLSESEKHEVEKGMMDSDFEADALEGLQGMQDKRKINHLIEQLNADLRNKTQKKKRFRQKLELKLDPSLIIAVVIILLIAVISFLVIFQVMQK